MYKTLCSNNPQNLFLDVCTNFATFWHSEIVKSRLYMRYCYFKVFLVHNTGICCTNQRFFCHVRLCIISQNFFSNSTENEDHTFCSGFQNF